MQLIKIIGAIFAVNLILLVPFLFIQSIGHRAARVSLHIRNRTDKAIHIGVSYDFKYKDVPTDIRLKPRERRDFEPVMVIRGPHDLMEFSVGNKKTQVYLYENDKGLGEKAVYVDVAPNSMVARVSSL